MNNEYWDHAEELFAALQKLIREPADLTPEDTADGGVRLNDFGTRLAHLGSEFTTVANVAAYRQDKQHVAE